MKISIRSRWAALCAAAVCCVAGPALADWHEVRPPVSSAPLAAGFHGRAVALERMTETDIAGDESRKEVRVPAWRNERVSAQYLVWTGSGVKGVTLAVSDFTGEHGGRIPASAAKARFVRYVLASQKRGKDKSARFVGDGLDEGPSVDLPANGYRPLWLTLDVPKDAVPDAYRGTLTATGASGERLEFTLVVDVRYDVLRDPKDWAFFLDLWQHPWAVARYHNVKPFSKEHYALLRPLFRELANAGQKTVTATLVDLPWNHQNYDPYWGMVGHVRQADGTFRRDFRLFDEYVAFALSCGLGPQIHCYTMASWGNIVYFTDGATGRKEKVKLVAGTSEHEAFWGPFLEEFERHLRAKGWLGRTYIALDERSREELLATADCLRRHAPGLKIQLAGNQPPSAFKGVEIHNYSQALLPGCLTPAFLKEAETRRARGLVTTCYVCCSPEMPNTFTTSSLAESAFLGIHSRTRGLDGLLRWAAFNWPEDPERDSSFGDWPAGDTYLIYPDARPSTRFEMLRDSIENFEKLRVLQESGRATWRLAASYAKWDYAALSKTNAAAFAACVKSVEEAIDCMCCPGYLHGRRVECENRTYGADLGYRTPVEEMHLVQHPVAAWDRPGRPLYVVLHSSGHNAVNALLCTRTPDNHDIYRAPDDFFALYLDCKTAPGDWWYGINGTPGFGLSSCERRMLRTIEETVVRYGIDRERIYLCGNSMGGSGCLGFGIRHGDVFAAVKGNVPALTQHACDRMGWDWKADRDVAGAAWRELPDPPLIIDHTAPNDMRWSEGREHFYRMMQTRRYPYQAYWADHRHCNQNRIITKANDLYLAFDWTNVRKGELLPAFSSASCDTPCPWPDHRDAKGAGQMNAYFRWANGAATADAAAIDLFIGDLTSRTLAVPETAVTDVTLRRTGAFRVRPGETVAWTFGDASGRVTVGDGARVTVPKLKLTKAPARLTVRKTN